MLFKRTAIATAVILAGCSNLGDGYYPPSDGYDRGYGGGYYDDGYRYERERERARRERHELERERDRLERSRERLERERREAEEERRKRPPRQPKPEPEKCAPGFRESDTKCSPQERKRGCKDIRMPSGKLCVKR